MSKFQVLYQTTNTILKVNADTNDKFIVRAGAMVAMDDVFDMKLKSGGVKKAIGECLQDKVHSFKNTLLIHRGNYYFHQHFWEIFNYLKWMVVEIIG